MSTTRNFNTTLGAYTRISAVNLSLREDGIVDVTYTERPAAVVAGAVHYLAGDPVDRGFSLTPEQIQTLTAPLIDPATGAHIGGNATALGLYANLLAILRQHQESVA